MTVAVKTTLKALIALFVVTLALAGVSCSAVNPSALSVGGWSLSDREFEDQMSSFAEVYRNATGSDAELRSPDGSSWATSFTAAFLNDRLSLQLAIVGADERGLTITDADRSAALGLLEQNFSSSNGSTFFGDLPAGYREDLVEGVAAQNVLASAILEEASSDDGLRRIYESDPEAFGAERACVRHILIRAGNGSAAPTEAEYSAALVEINSVRGRITSVSDFATIAGSTSDDTGSATAGGSLGCSERGAFVEQFDDAVWSQPIGSVGEPVRTQFGWHLVLVESRGVLGFDELKDELRASVRDSARQLVSAELVRIAAGTSVSVDGRFGRFDAATAQILPPSGASTPSTVIPPPGVGIAPGSAPGGGSGE